MAPQRRKCRRPGLRPNKKKLPPALAARARRDDSSSRSGSDGSATHTSEEDSSSESSISDEDDPRDYKRGGYHPVTPFQLYNGRYRVLSKLGAGAFSTVWLCADEKHQMAEGSPELVAMKVCKSKKSVTEQAQDEVALLDRLQEVSAGARSPHVVQMRGHFWHAGPNGRHKAMVFEVMGENLLALVKYYDYKGLPLQMVRRLTRHTLKGLEYIHSQGVIHTDVKLENVLVQRHDLAELLAEARLAHRAFTEQRQQSETLPAGNAGTSTLTKNQKKKLKKKAKNAAAKIQDEGKAESDAEGVAAAGPAEEPADAKADGAGEQEAPGAGDGETAAAASCSRPVPPVRQRTRFATLQDDKAFAKLADFGNGCFRNRKVTDDIQTRQYRSPEVIIGCDWDETADVWSASCMFFELITGDFLFDPRSSEDLSRDEDHLALMIELLGDYPRKEWALSGKYSRDFFAASSGKLKHVKHLKYWSLPDVLEEKYDHPREEAEEISAFLLPMLRWEPRHRQKASDALKSPWLKLLPGEVDKEAVYTSAPAPAAASAPPTAPEPQEAEAEAAAPPLEFHPPPRGAAASPTPGAEATEEAVPAPAAEGGAAEAKAPAAVEETAQEEAPAAAPQLGEAKAGAKNDDTSTRDTSPGTGHSSASTPDGSPAEEAVPAARAAAAAAAAAPEAAAAAAAPEAATPAKDAAPAAEAPATAGGVDKEKESEAAAAELLAEEEEEKQKAKAATEAGDAPAAKAKRKKKKKGNK